MNWRIAAVVLTVVLIPTLRAQSSSEAFRQGAALGSSGNAAARARLDSNTAQASVPGYNNNPPQTAYFVGTGIAGAAAAAANACAGPGLGTSPGYAAQACNAVNFSQTNPMRRPSFSIAPTDPLLTNAKAITGDSQRIAGNIAGSYSDCTVLTSTTPDRFESKLCHQYRQTDSLSCVKRLIVSPLQTPGCSDGQFLTRVTADPCPDCTDSLAFDFSCGTDSYLMHVFTLDKVSGRVYMDLGSQQVPGVLNTQIPQTPGPSQIDDSLCYQTFFSQSCDGANCDIGAWFANPCQGTSYYGLSRFAMPTTLSFTDTWDDQCAALEARTR